MLNYFQRLLLVAGLSLLATYVLLLTYRSASSQAALASFDQALDARRGAIYEDASSLGDEPVDFTLWSESRVRKYEKSLLIEKRLPLAVLSIAKIGLRVPVLEGTDELALNRGVGRISGTAEPGESGNIGIAGHRDGVFRGLKDIVVGDVVELTTLREKTTYVVDEIEIVGPTHVEVLRPRGFPTLTLVTCFPFYFIGDAPERYIVHAALKQSVAANEVHRASR